MLGLGTGINKLSAAEAASISARNAGSYLLDDYSGAAAAYSLRQLSSTYSGSSVKVRRASDNVEADIGFASGELDTAALASHCGASDGFVSVWYDQANSNNATQATAAAQPKIYDGTTGVVTENGKPAVKFDGVNDVLTRTIPNNQVAAMTAFSVHRITANKGYIYGWFNSSSGSANVISYEGTPAKYRFGWAASLIGIDTGSQLLFTGRQDGTSGLMNINGVSQGSFNVDASRYWDNAFSIGKTIWGPSPEINISEYVMYYTAQTNGNISDIEDNINTFYSIY
jgi:hypothetical protein